MSKANQLSATQQQILEHAIDHTEGRIDWFPSSIKGGAQKTVLSSLKSRGLIQYRGQHPHITPAAYAAIGRSTPDEAEDAPANPQTPVAVSAQEIQHTVEEQVQPLTEGAMPEQTPAEAASTADADDGTEPDADDSIDHIPAMKEEPAEGAVAPQVPPPKVKRGSKQATVVAMMKRPEGATIKQIMEATEWQSHTVRGMISGTLRKKLQLNVVGEKQEGGQETIYRIV